MLIKQISIFVENKPGRLSNITNILKQNDIDIRALSIADTKDFGILRLIVNDPDKACNVLKGAECTVTITDVLAVGISDEPGGLSVVMNTLLLPCLQFSSSDMDPLVLFSVTQHYFQSIDMPD